MLFSLLATILFAIDTHAAAPARLPKEPLKPLRISAPRTLTQCGIATFTWTPTVPPYHLTVLRATDADGSAGYVNDADAAVIPKRATASWIVDYPAGTTVRVFIRDGRGGITGTVPMLIQEGHDECMDGDEGEGEEDEEGVDLNLQARSDAHRDRDWGREMEEQDWWRMMNYDIGSDKEVPLWDEN